MFNEESTEGAEIVEELPFLDYVVWEETPSQIDPAAVLRVGVDLRCPRCKELLGTVPGHGGLIDGMVWNTVHICAGCGLKMIRHGNVLECTLPTKPENTKSACRLEKDGVRLTISKTVSSKK